MENHAGSLESEKILASEEMQLKKQELQLLQAKVETQNRLVNIIAIMVPVIAALVTAVPAYINSENQKELKELEIEGQLIMNSIKTGDPDQAAQNLKFLVESGLLRDDTADRLSKHLENRRPRTGRALPAN